MAARVLPALPTCMDLKAKHLSDDGTRRNSLARLNLAIETEALERGTDLPRHTNLDLLHHF